MRGNYIAISEDVCIDEFYLIFCLSYSNLNTRRVLKNFSIREVINNTRYIFLCHKSEFYEDHYSSNFRLEEENLYTFIKAVRVSMEIRRKQEGREFEYFIVSDGSPEQRAVISHIENAIQKTEKLYL